MMVCRKIALLVLVGTSFSMVYSADPLTPKDGVKADEVKKEVTVSGSLQGGKIGVVNEMEAMQTSKKGAEIAKQLEAKRQGFTADLKKQEQVIKQAMNDYKTKEATMSAQARNAEEAKLTKMSRDFESAVKEKDEELKFAMQQATEELSLEVEKVVSEYAQSHSYDIIFGLYTGRVIYASPKSMVTTDIVKAMDKASAKPATPPAAAPAPKAAA